MEKKYYDIFVHKLQPSGKYYLSGHFEMFGSESDIKRWISEHKNIFCKYYYKVSVYRLPDSFNPFEMLINNEI